MVQSRSGFGFTGPASRFLVRLKIADQVLKNDEYRQDRAAEGRNLVWQQRRKFGVRAEHQLIAKPNKGVGDEVDARIADGFPRQGTEI
jgi:hypothetical protein